MFYKVTEIKEITDKTSSESLISINWAIILSL
jgi:hypothetical protein